MWAPVRVVSQTKSRQNTHPKYITALFRAQGTITFSSNGGETWAAGQCVTCTDGGGDTAKIVADAGSDSWNQAPTRCFGGRMCTHRGPFNSTPTQWGVNSISFGPPRVCPMGRTCGEPNEIKKNTHP